MLLSMDEFRAFEPKKTTYALFGWPLGHTMSPELHAQLFEASGQDADYIGVAVPPEDLPEAFELAKRKLGGINCTIPHKKAVIPLLDDIDTAARDLHSVNTVRFADGKATGFNTDILGFAESLNRDGVSLQGKKVLLLGYGGAASVMAYHYGTQSREGRGAAEAADRCRSGRTHFRVQPPAYSARYSYRAQFHAGGHVPEGKRGSAALSAAQDRVCVRCDLQSAGDLDHKARQSTQDQNTRRTVHAGHAGGARADHLDRRDL